MFAAGCLFSEDEADAQAGEGSCFSWCDGSFEGVTDIKGRAYARHAEETVLSMAGDSWVTQES